MAVGDILFYHADDFGGKLIQWRTRGPYTHVCIEVERGAVIEAKYPLVSLDVQGTPTARYTPELDELMLPTALIWLHGTVGDQYDVWDIVANAFGFIIGHPVTSKTPTAFICSELATWFLIKAGYHFPPGFKTDEGSIDLISPNHLARLVGIL